jgi:hypothetical protein
VSSPTYRHGMLDAEVRQGIGASVRKEKARSPAGSNRAANRKAPRPFVISGPASLITPSWNQVVAFLTDWEGLRRMAS